MRIILTLLFSLFMFTGCATTHKETIGIHVQAVSAKPNQDQQEESQHIQKNIEELLVLITILCEETYPLPKNLNECFDKAKHGAATAFGTRSQYLNTQEARLYMENMRGSYGGLGAQIVKPSTLGPVIIVDVIPGTSAEELGLKMGDIIETINGKNTTLYETIDDILRDLRGPVDSKVTLEFRRGATAVVDPPVTIVRKKVESESVKGLLVTHKGKTYGVLQTREFSRDFSQKMLGLIQKLTKESKGSMTGLIVSVENNPGGLLNEAWSTIDVFLDAPEFILYRDNNGISSVASTYKALKRTPGDATNGLPLLVIVNKDSASASEIFAKAMQHFGRGVIAGSSGTHQKGSVQTILPLTDDENGPLVKINTAEYLIGTEDDWVPVHCVGIIPDIIDAELAPPASEKDDESLTECNLPGSFKSEGAMKNAPKHLPIQEANPSLYANAKEMLEAYKVFKVEEDKKSAAKRELLKKWKK